jgi:hypothetical protein
MRIVSATKVTSHIGLEGYRNLRVQQVQNIILQHIFGSSIIYFCRYMQIKKRIFLIVQ